jgi:hypothetical protein
MRFGTLLACLIVLTMAVLPATSKVEEKPNTLTKPEIEKGWLLLFDGETTWGWRVPEGPVKWTVVDGVLQAEGDGVSELPNTTVFGDFEMTLEARAGSDQKWGTVKLSRKGNGKASSTFAKCESGLPVSLIHTTGTVQFRNIKLRPLSLESIFNGKDLAGWNVIPAHQSVFTVTPEGWLNVKNGNGDIQTDKTWGNFVLQLNIFSNGDHLNSGVFFRANKGLFWSGYEAQIRNQWEEDNRNKPVDFGTGAIYNRQPARKVVSSDREWFKMTVTASEYHLATWVNGYQVADFDDPRPVDETNARKGARKAPGVISIQGHDPTTDLSFRDIQIVEIPPAK